MPHKRTTHRRRPGKTLFAVRDAKRRLTENYTHERIARHGQLRASKIEHRAKKR